MFEAQGFDFRIQAVAIVAAIVLVASIVELVRRRQLGEAHSIAWLIVSAIVVVFALFRGLQELIADLIGVYYPPSLIFGVLIFVLLGLVLYLSVVLTQVEMRGRALAQRLALLEETVQRHSEDKEGGGQEGTDG